MSTYRMITISANAFATAYGFENPGTLYVFTCAEKIKANIAEEGTFRGVERYWESILKRAKRLMVCEE